MQARFWLAPIALFLASLPRTTLAQDNPRIYLTPGQVVGEPNNTPSDSLDSALLSAVGDRPIIILTPSTSTGVDLGDVTAKLKEGQKQVESAPDKAIDTLKKVVDTYEASMAQVSDLEPYFQALSLLATAYFNGGYEDEFSEAVKKYAALRPEGVPKGTNEEVADELTKAQKKSKAAAPGTVKLTISEASFQVKVDGQDLASAKSFQLAPGVHFVVVTAPSKNPYVEKVKVTSSGVSQVSVNLTDANADNATASSIEKATTAPSKELIELLKKGTLNADARKMAVDLANKNKADLVVLNMVARDSGQYRAYFYALRAKDASVVELALPSYKPGPAATLATPADEVLGQLVSVAYNFPKAKAIPAAPGITVAPKGAVAIVSNVPENTDPDPTNPNPTNTDPTPKNPTKVDPYTVGVAALPTDAVLTAPPDANPNNKENPRVSTYVPVKVDNTPKETTPKEVTPKEATPKESGALSTPKETKPPREPREPINFGAIVEKPWFWPVVGAVGAGAAGTGAFFVLKPNGLDATLTWP